MEPMATTVAGDEPETAAKRLVEMCLERGAPDNVTVIAVRCHEITLLSLTPAGVAT